MAHVLLSNITRESESSTTSTAALTMVLSTIQECSKWVALFLNTLSQETGWAFMVLMGGPDPEKPGGDITVFRYDFHA
jgi:hypothetical protein